MFHRENVSRETSPRETGPRETSPRETIACRVRDPRGRGFLSLLPSNLSSILRFSQRDAVDVVPYKYAYSVHKIATCSHAIGWAQIGFLAGMIAGENAMVPTIPFRVRRGRRPLRIRI